jgi:uncharacterized protein (DUF433 family)
VVCVSRNAAPNTADLRLPAELTAGYDNGALAAEAAAMMLPDFLTERPDASIVLTGHRVSLYHIVRYYDEGFSAEMLVEQFPTLPLAHVHKVIAFYLENRDAVDAYVTRVREELDRQRAAGSHVDLVALRERLSARQKAEAPAATPGR